MSTLVVLTGGGIKGAVAAGRYAREHDLVLLHIDYGQAAASGQSRALAMLAAYWPSARLCSLVLPQLKNIPSAVRAGAGTVIGNDPTRNKSDEAARIFSLRGLMPTMLSLGAQTALRFGAASLVVGVSAHVGGEHIGLPGAEAGADARHELLHSFDVLLETALRPKIRIRMESPLMDLSYGQIVKLGQRFEIPWERTHTCETTAGAACGRCDSCRARTAAFVEAGLRDPLSTVVTPAAAALRPA